jgi:hypothetical protein
MSPYVCPHCGANQFIGHGKGFGYNFDYTELDVGGLPQTEDGKDACIGIKAHASLCSRCLEPSIHVEIVLKEKDTFVGSTGRPQKIRGGAVKTYYKDHVYPDVTIPIVHSSVPQPLADDHREAWSILQRSPKSSAVLARRCIQGAIRDFCKINGRTLNIEINELSERYQNHTLDADCAPYVTAELIDLLDKVRKMGNVGAHMEKDVNKVIPVEPGEAAMLLRLVGTLFEDWYKARSDRQERLKQLAKVIAAKDAAKKAAS